MAQNWTGTKQRNDLPRCPFCQTYAVQQVRLADSDTDMQFRIGCGNMFCHVEPNTPPSRCSAMTPDMSDLAKRLSLEIMVLERLMLRALTREERDKAKADYEACCRAFELEVDPEFARRAA